MRRRLQIHYRTRKLERQCTISVEARKTYGLDIAAKLQQRIAEIEAADTLDMLVQYNIGRCHVLLGGRQGQYAMDLVHPHRLIIEKDHNDMSVALIVDIIDYH
jgi:plasmid maintenance system killer protein